jgi:putative flavoprotein involved in K+ transport
VTDRHDEESFVAKLTATTIRAQAEGWIEGLAAALSSGDAAMVAALFLEESYWRDLVAFTWDTRQFWGRDQVVGGLLEYSSTATPHDFRIDSGRSAPRILDNGAAADFFIAFDTTTGSASALATVVSDGDSACGLRARLIATSLTGLHVHEVPRPTRRGYVPDRPGETWIQHRTRIRDFATHDPDVLVVGGSQSGVTMGARLDRLGVSYLVIDKEPRAGTTWRGRYSSLALHTPTCVNDLPYVRQPATYPGFLSKDQWADYIDAYVELMNLSWWGCTEFLSGTFDEATRTWNAELRLADGTTRVMHPKHLVAALGYTGTEPYLPDLAGLADFTGEVLHSSHFAGGEPYRGQAVLVVGTATSGHDIALDLCENGAAVSMGQRGPACVVPVDEAEKFNVDYLNREMTVEEIDQRRNSGFVYPLLLKRAQAETQRTERQYAEMFDGLRKAGMTLTIGEDKAGWLMKLHKTFSGYYLDVGASQAIIDRRIKIVQLSDVDTFVPAGVRLKDGTIVKLDAVVLATGYHNNRATIERLLGPGVAAKVGLVGGIGEDGEHRNLARPTGQPHLWMLFGGIMDARKMSELLAFQIIAQLKGVVPTYVRGEDGGLCAMAPAAALTGAAS